MKTQQQDRFWRWFGLFFATGVVACFVLAFVLIEFRTVELEAVAAQTSVAATTTSTADAWWITPPYDPSFHPW